MSYYQFSIIIPHKNIPDLLLRCLDSIPKRDDVQIIIVDDNSDSKLVDFEHFPGIGRPNTEVFFDKTNRGAGRARNVGLEHAKGKWLLFADSDDIYNTEALNVLFDTNVPEDCKVVWWGTEYLLLDGSIERRDNIEDDYLLRLYPYPQKLRSEFAPWKKMVRTSHAKENNILFDETIASNDVMFHTLLLGITPEESIYWFPQVVYIWGQRNNSTMNTYTLENSLSRLKVSIRANTYAYKKGWGLIDNTKEYLWRVKQHSWYYFYKYYLVCCRTFSMQIGWCLFYDVCKKDGNRLAILLNPCSVVLLKNRLLNKRPRI